MTTVTTADAIWSIDNLARIRVAGTDSDRQLAVVESEGRRSDMRQLTSTGATTRRSTCSRAASRCTFPGDRRRSARARPFWHPGRAPHTLSRQSETARWLAIVTPAGFDDLVRGRRAGLQGGPLPAEGPGAIRRTWLGTRLGASGSSCWGLPGRWHNLSPLPWAGAAAGDRAGPGPGCSAFARRCSAGGRDPRCRRLGLSGPAGGGSRPSSKGRPMAAMEMDVPGFPRPGRRAPRSTEPRSSRKSPRASRGSRSARAGAGPGGARRGDGDPAWSAAPSGRRRAAGRGAVRPAAAAALPRTRASRRRGSPRRSRARGGRRGR